LVKFNDDDFELFVNLSNPKKRYYYAEKIINNCVMEVTAIWDKVECDGNCLMEEVEQLVDELKNL